MSLIKKDQDTARRKGLTAGAVTAVSLGLIAVGAWPFGVVGLVSSALLTADWFRFRAVRGMRF